MKVRAHITVQRIVDLDAPSTAPEDVSDALHADHLTPDEVLLSVDQTNHLKTFVVHEERTYRVEAISNKEARHIVLERTPGIFETHIRKADEDV